MKFVRLRAMSSGAEPSLGQEISAEALYA